MRGPAPRPEEASRWADSVRSLLTGIPTLVDVRHAFAGTQPSVEVTFERQRIAQRNLSLDAVSGAIAGGLGGVRANDFRETDRRTPIRVRFAGSANEDLATALATPVGGVPAGQLVQVEEKPAPIEVVRVDQRPVSVVEALVERGGTTRATRDVRRALGRLDPPPGLSWVLGGADVEQRRTSRELGLVALLSVALVFLVLAGEFASFTSPLIVMTTVPLALGPSMIYSNRLSKETGGCIGRYNPPRRHRALGHQSPMTYERITSDAACNPSHQPSTKPGALHGLNPTFSPGLDLGGAPSRSAMQLVQR